MNSPTWRIGAKPIAAALAGSILVFGLVQAPHADALPGPGSIPITITNDTGSDQPVHVYITAVDNTDPDGVDNLGYVDADGRYHTWPKVTGPTAVAAPDVPFPYDLHNDHRALFHAASVAWRPSSELWRGIKRVLAYEVQSETHWNAPYLEPGFTPNIWIELTDEQLHTKLAALSHYESQMRPFPDARSLEAIEHLARWRGSQQGMHAAEGFVLVKETR